MEKGLSFANALSYIRNMETEFAEKPSKTVIIIGEEGTGKYPLLKLLIKDFKELGQKFYSTRIFADVETGIFYPFNDILNQITQESKIRDLNTIVESMTAILSQTDHPVLVFENIHKMSQQSLDMFLYFSRLTEKLGFTLIGLGESSGNYPNTEKFIEEAKTLSSIIIITLKKPEMDDVKTLLKEEGYRLEDAFVKDLVRLVNGDLNVLSYTLAYYKEEGFINPDGALNDVKVRFFPIPPSVETHFNNLISELNKNATDILKTLAMVKDRLSLNDLCLLVHEDSKVILDSLAILESKDLITSDQEYFFIQNSFLFPILEKRISSIDKIRVSKLLNETELIKKVSVPSRILINLGYGNVDEAVKIFSENVEEINNSISNPQEVYESMSKIKPYISDKKLLIHASFYQGKALYLLSRYDEALEIFKSEDFQSNGIIEPYLLSSSIYNSRGDYKNSDIILANIISRDMLSKKNEAKVLIAQATIYIRKNDYKKAEELVDLAINIATEGNYENTLSEAYNIKGIIRINTFNIEDAGNYFERALEINTRKKNWFSRLKNMNNLSITNGMLGHYDESIKNFKDIIDISYITSDLRGRAYAEFNLVEQLDIIGESAESENYIPTAEKLVSLISDQSLASSFHRFYGLHLIQNCIFDRAKEEFEISIRKAEEIKDKQRVRINKFFVLLMDEIVNGKKLQEIDDIISQKFELEEDFIPVIYIFITLRYIYHGEFDLAIKSSYDAVETAVKIGDNGYKTHSSILPSLVYFLKGDREAFTKEFEKIKTLDKNIQYPNYVYRALKAYLSNNLDGVKELRDIINSSKTSKMPSLDKLLLQLLISFIEDKITSDTGINPDNMAKFRKQILECYSRSKLR